MPSTQTDLLNMMFNLADMADKPLCPDYVLDRTGQAGILDAPPRDSGDLELYAAAACDLLLLDAQSQGRYVYTGQSTPAMAVTRLRMMAFVASVLVPRAVHDYDGRYSVTLDEDGYLPALDGLELAVRFAVSELGGYLAEHHAGQWVDPNAVAGAVVNLHDAALAVETWWSLTTAAEDAQGAHGADGADV